MSFPAISKPSTKAIKLGKRSKGIGVLLMSYAVSQGGWLGFVLFFVIVIIFCYTGHLIQQCMDADPSINSYGDIEAATFGYKGRVAVAFITYIEMYLTVVGFLIMEGDNLDKFFPNTSIEIGSLTIKEKQLFILVAALIILPTTWLRDLSILAYFSAAGFFSSFILSGSLLWTGIVDTGFHEKGKAVNLSGLPTTVCLYAICFCGHAVFPTIYSSMTETTRFSKMITWPFGVGVGRFLGHCDRGELHVCDANEWNRTERKGPVLQGRSAKTVL